MNDNNNDAVVEPPDVPAVAMTTMPEGLVYVTADATLCPAGEHEVGHITVGIQQEIGFEEVGDYRESFYLDPIDAVRLARGLLDVAVPMINADIYGPLGDDGDDEVDLGPPDLHTV